MTIARETFQLTTSDGDDAPVLRGMQADATLDGLLYQMTLRQIYRNETDRVLEVVYTFPLQPQAVLLGFAAELGGRRLEGAITPRAEAEAVYERALADGDAPVLLERLDSGLHTANIGNLKPGEQIVLEVRQAQLLRWDQGRLRLSLPTTLAPRYGRPADAGLQPQQEPVTSLDVEHAFGFSMRLRGGLADTQVDCPTHALRRVNDVDGLCLSLAAPAWLDRDLVLVVQAAGPQASFVAVAHDARAPGAPTVLMASLQVPQAAERERIALKLLVDCSGSMGGDSIDSARRALHGVMGTLRAGDHVSLSRFGSRVEHPMRPAQWGPQRTSQLAALIDRTDATMGGTEMEEALREVLDLPMSAVDGIYDVLLITDGEIWAADALVQAARGGGHRVFVIAVGSAPAQAVAVAIADATGGACEFATPGEALEQAARRMMQRIRQQPWAQPRIDWGVPVAWATPLPATVYGGDTVLAFAGTADDATTARPSLEACPAAARGHQRLARAGSAVRVPGDGLSRIAAARRLPDATPGQARDLALAYALLTDQTRCVLVHQRAEADKSTQAAELHRVSAMLAAGWGGTSTVQEHSACLSMPTHAMWSMTSASGGMASRAFVSLPSPPLRPPVASMASSDLVSHEHTSDDDASEQFEVDRTAPPVNWRPPDLLDLALYVLRHQALRRPASQLPDEMASPPPPDAALQALQALGTAGFDAAQAWLLLAWYVLYPREGWRLLSPDEDLVGLVDDLPADALRRGQAVLDGLLGALPLQVPADPPPGPGPGRTARLQRAMARSSAGRP